MARKPWMKAGLLKPDTVNMTNTSRMTRISPCIALVDDDEFLLEALALLLRLVDFMRAPAHQRKSFSGRCMKAVVITDLKCHS